MDLSIIIVNWNSIEYLEKCLSSIYRHALGMQFEVIVVDNASYDGCAAMLEKSFPGVRFIQSTENLGFARANNLAFSKSTGRTLLFLNPDTEITAGALERMLTVFESKPDAGVVGCRLLNGDLSIQITSVQAFPTILNEALDITCLREWFPSSRLWGNAALWEREPCVREVDCISGACLMIRRDVFDAVGQFSPGYFMYVEDRDLCYKVRQAGHKSYFINTAEVIHYGGTSSGSRPESSFEAVMRCESLFSFMRRRRGKLYAGMYRLTMAAAAVGRLAALGIFSAFRSRRNRDEQLRNALTKWVSIFRWTAGFVSWARG
jgi:GT2 family glycosyltransferase